MMAPRKKAKATTDLNALLAAYNTAASDFLAKNTALGNAETDEGNKKQAYLQAVPTGDTGQIYPAALAWLQSSARLTTAQQAFHTSHANYVTASSNLLTGLRNALP